MNTMVGITTEHVVLTVIDRFGFILPSQVVNKDIIFAPDDIALRQRADHTDKGVVIGEAGSQEVTKKYALDFINVWIRDVSFSWKRQRTSVARLGISTKYLDKVPGSNDRGNIEAFKAVPADIIYGITFWTTSRLKMDQFIQEFMFWQQEDPNINIMFDNDKPLELDVLIDPAVAIDDSKITNMYKEGKYWKHTFYFTVESWLFKGIALKTVKKIVIDEYTDRSYLAAPETLVLEETITPKVLKVAVMVGDLTNIDVNERAVYDFVVALGHVPTFLDAIDLSIANTYDVLIFGFWWVSKDISALKASTAAIILLYSNDSLGLGGASVITSSTIIDIVNKNHYITQTMTEYSPIVQVPPAVNDLSGYARIGGAAKLLGAALSNKILFAYEKGDETFSGDIAPERRMHLGLFQFFYATETGKTLLSRSIGWAGHLDQDATVVSVVIP